jgi:hypothetical protein
METLLLVALTILFVAWITGLLLSNRRVWENNIGDYGLQHKLKKTIYLRKKTTG